jgi:hypothetical protein
LLGQPEGKALPLEHSLLCLLLLPQACLQVVRMLRLQQILLDDPWRVQAAGAHGHSRLRCCHT